MEQLKIIEVKEDILLRNSSLGEKLRFELRQKGIFFINLMSSPGSGKTTLLLNLISRLKNDYRIGVLEADIDSDVDAKKIQEKCGVRVAQIHTGGACHLTAQMVMDALKEFEINDLDILILENVGNLVCPAEFDVGAHMNLVLLSTPEGDDKPLKYPLMFEVANLVLITKSDVAHIFDFDFEKARENIKKRNRDIDVISISALKDENVDNVSGYIGKIIKNFKNINL